MIYIGSGAQDNPRYYHVKHITVKPITKHILKIKLTGTHKSHQRPFTFLFSGAAGCWIADSSYTCSLLLQLWPETGSAP